MGLISDAEILDLWEAATQRDAVDRAIVLAAAAPVVATDAAGGFALLPIGQRDANLVALHVAISGGTFEAVAGCPACGGTAEVSIDASALMAIGEQGIPVEPLEIGDYTIEWRPPDSLDLHAAASAGEAGAAERVLLERCVISAAGPQGATDGPSLAPDVLAALADAMAAADPLAEVQLDASCPECGRPFVTSLEIGEFVWTELVARARQIMREVNQLAHAYGWNEAEVLALSERRRAAYLELATATVA